MQLNKTMESSMAVSGNPIPWQKVTNESQLFIQSGSNSISPAVSTTFLLDSESTPRFLISLRGLLTCLQVVYQVHSKWMAGREASHDLLL